MRKGISPLTAPARFWNKVSRWDPDHCWLWLGGLTGRGGYGQIGVSEKKVLAHRFAYELLVGPIPVGLEIDHLCRNRICVNPKHMEPVVGHVNILRGTGWSARHARKTHCPHGHPYSPDNTYRDPQGGRRCRTCMREHDRARWPQRRERENPRRRLRWRRNHR